MLELFHGEEYARISDTIRKTHANLNFRAEKSIVAISGGSDSDVVLDVIRSLEPEKNYPHAELHYVWFDTGMEYDATKKHLDFLEEKYGIKIERERAKVPVPLGCKNYGLPFLSKQAAAYINRLQSHGFDFAKYGTASFSELYAIFPKCKAALRFWCNEWGEDSRMNISSYRLLKEFMIENPPPFRISDKCCSGAKKDVAHDFIKRNKIVLNIVGVRRAEGGARATSYSSCFSDPNNRGDIAQFRPLFFWTDQDKEIYCEKMGVTHSDLYERYGFLRTGCACCPFGSRFEQELIIAERIDPRLEMAARKIFGPAYDYTRAYRQYKAIKDAEKKADPSQINIWDYGRDAV